MDVGGWFRILVHPRAIHTSGSLTVSALISFSWNPHSQQLGVSFQEADHWQTMATRRNLEPLLLPPYDFEQVPMAQRDLQNSVVVKLSKREKWLSHLSSMLILCNEAAYRRTKKLPPGTVEHGSTAKPLGLEYMADRIDTDDPLWGYQVGSYDYSPSGGPLWSQHASRIETHG